MKKCIAILGVVFAVTTLVALLDAMITPLDSQPVAVAPAPVVVQRDSFWQDLFMYHMLFGGDHYYYHPFGYGGFVSHPFGFYHAYRSSRTVIVNKTVNKTIINKSVTVSKPASRLGSFFKPGSVSSSAKSYSSYKPSMGGYGSARSYSSFGSSSFGSSSFGRSSFSGGRR